MLLYSIGHLWLHPVALISLLYLLPLVIGFSNLNCASRHSRNFNVYAALYDMTSTELWLISSTEVVRISNTMVINTSPPVIQIGRVAAQKHALSAEVLSRDNIIGLFSIESSIYLATNQKGSARKVTIFREVHKHLLSFVTLVLQFKRFSLHWADTHNADSTTKF